MKPLKKTEIRVLGRIFVREIANLLPAQFKSKSLPSLERRGFVEKMERKLQGFPPMIVRGWCLTELGRRAYCHWAAQQREME